MLRYLLRRLLLAIVTLWAITVVTFIILQLPPGDFVDAYVAQASAMGTAISAAEAAALRHAYGLDQSYLVQYVKWLNLILHGEFGTSFEYSRPVTEVIGDRLWLTMVLSFAAIIVTWVLALPIGIYSAVRQYPIGDYVFTFIGFIGLAVPSFLLALIVMYLGLRWFNVNLGGLFSPDYQLAPWSWGKVLDLLKHLHRLLRRGLRQHWSRINLSGQRLPCVNGLLKVGKIVDAVEPTVKPEWFAGVVVKLDSAEGVVPLDDTNVLIKDGTVDGQRTSIDSDHVVMNQDCHEHPSAFLLGRC